METFSLTNSPPKPYPKQNYEPYRASGNPYANRYLQLPSHAPTAFSSNATEQFRGQWQKFFGASPKQKLHVELGSYHGETLITMAKQHPEELFIGVEWKFKECFRAAEKAIHEQIPNICFLRANLARLPWMFAPHEIDQVWIAFPDPWPKKNQQKWRTLHSDFFRSLGLLLSPNKKVLLKTDHIDYAAHIVEAVKESQAFHTLDETLTSNLWKTFPDTPFERIFLRNAKTIFSLALERNGNPITPPLPVQEIFQSPT